MFMQPTKKNFGCKIPGDLKDQIDFQVDNTRLPMGRIVEALAEFWAGLSEEDQKHLCYGTNQLSLTQFIDARIHAILNKPQADSEPQPTEIDFLASIENLIYHVRYKLLSPEEQRALAKFRREIGPDPAKKKKKKSAS